MRGVVVGLVVAGLLVGGAAIADGVARERTQDALAANLQEQVPGLESQPVVTIRGFPFLTQVLGGELDDVRLTADSVTVEGLQLDDVDVRLAGVSTDQPTTARHVTMTASTTLESIQGVLDVPVDLSIEDGVLVASTTLLGLQLDALLTPRPDGRQIAVDIDGVRLGGRTIDAADLPEAITDQLDSLAIPIDALPEGLELTAVTLTSDGAALEAAGDDLVFE